MEATERNTLESVNNGFGPISVRRGNKATHMSWLLLLVFLTIAGIWLYKNEDKQDLKSWYFELTSLLLTVVGAIFGEFLRRCCLLYEEYDHVDNRYLGKVKDAILACFYQKNIQQIFIIGIICFAFALILLRDQNGVFDSKHVENTFMGTVLTPLLSYVMDLRTPTEAEKSQMSEAESSNVADGLAWSYYFGYLKLILPHLDETINKTDLKIDGGHFRDKVAANKLYIVLPKNCYCYESFDKMDPRITMIDSTQPLHISRAGVARRVYKNTIYQIAVGERKFHCLMEYATPLQSMYDMYRMLKNEKNPRMESKTLDQQVVQFVKKLNEILEDDPECRGKYQLVTVADAHEDLADTIVREIMDPQISIGA